MDLKQLSRGDLVILGLVGVFSLIVGVILVRFLLKGTSQTPSKGKKQKPAQPKPASKPAAKDSKPAQAKDSKQPAASKPAEKGGSSDLKKTPAPASKPAAQPVKAAEPAKKPDPKPIESSRSVAVPESKPKGSAAKPTPAPAKQQPEPDLDDGFEVISKKRGAKKTASIPSVPAPAPASAPAPVAKPVAVETPKNLNEAPASISNLQAKKLRREQELAERELQKQKEEELLKKQEEEKLAQQQSAEAKKAAEFQKLFGESDAAKPEQKLKEQITTLQTTIERRVREAERLRETHLQRKRALKSEEKQLASAERRYNELLERQKAIEAAAQKQEESEPKPIEKLPVAPVELVMPKIDLQGSLAQIAQLKRDLQVRKENLAALHSRLGNSVVLSI